MLNHCSQLDPTAKRGRSPRFQHVVMLAAIIFFPEVLVAGLGPSLKS